PNEVTVEMDNGSFLPANAEVAVGGTVTWHNTSTIGHDVTPTGGHSAWIAEEDLVVDETFAVTFHDAGPYDYRCTLHSGMTGTVNVVAP
ncbi:MAG: plastocyanin, partial [Gemmatimonas sp.]|nr:plastocyanin [Gemmatimonas sp.]